MLASLIRTDAVFLEHSVTLDCSIPDSGYVETTRDVIIPLTGRGVRRYSELAVTFRNTWESITVLDATVIHWRPGRADGEALIENRPHGSLLPSGRMESSLRELILTYPGVEIGDTLILEVSRRIYRLPMEDLYSYTFLPAAIDSVHFSNLSLLWPTDSLLYTAGNLGEVFSYEAADGLTQYEWSAGPVSGLPGLPFTLGIMERAPFLTIASHTPEEVSARLWSVLQPSAVSDSTELAGIIIEETGGDPAALSEWIAEEVVYLSGDWGVDPGYSPRFPHETLEDRAGVCRDRVALLCWLLQEAGYEPTMLLTSTARGLGELAGSRSFDHILVSLVLPDGEVVFLDPTAPAAAGGFTYTLRGARYLPLSPDGSRMMSFPEAEPGADLLEIGIRGIFDPDSMLIRGEVTAEFYGAAEELFRSMLSSVPDSSQGVLLETLFGASEGSSLSLRNDALDLASPLTAFGTAVWEVRSVVWEGGTALLIPGLSDIDLVGGRASAYILPDAISAVFVETPYTCSLKFEISGMPEGALLPSPTALDGYAISMRMENGVLVMAETISLLPMIPETDELIAMREALAARLSGELRTVVLP